MQKACDWKRECYFQNKAVSIAITPKQQKYGFHPIFKLIVSPFEALSHYVKKVTTQRGNPSLLKKPPLTVPTELSLCIILAQACE